MLRTIRKWGYTLLSRHFYVGIGVGFFLASTMVFVSAQVVEEKPTAKVETVTYETICKGSFTVEETPTATIYKGSGAEANKYTFTEQKHATSS